MDPKFIAQRKKTLLALKAETEQDLHRMHENQTEGIAEGEAANQEELKTEFLRETQFLIAL